MVRPQISVGQVWMGRDITIRVIRVGVGLILVELIHIKLRDGYRVHPWSTANFDGMRLVVR